MPRSCSRPSTLSGECGDRSYIITARRMISGLVLKLRKGLGSVMAGSNASRPASTRQVLLTKPYEIQQATGSPIAAGVLSPIADLYAIE